MTGWLFKEFRHYWYIWIAALVLPFLTVIFTVWVFWQASVRHDTTLIDVFSDLHAAPLGSVLIALGFYLVFGMLLQTMFTGDESKKISSFAASVPGGYRKFVYTKYVYAFMVCGIYFLSMFWADQLLLTVSYMTTGIEQGSLFSFAMIMFFVQIFLLALDIPSVIRFGTIIGVKVKFAALGVLLLIGFIWLLFGPLPESADAFFGAIGSFLEKLRTGEYAEGMMLVICLLPPVSLLLYYFSYRLSCRVYLKGAENYER